MECPECGTEMVYMPVGCPLNCAECHKPYYAYVCLKCGKICREEEEDGRDKKSRRSL